MARLSNWGNSLAGGEGYTNKNYEPYGYFVEEEIFDEDFDDDPAMLILENFIKEMEQGFAEYERILNEGIDVDD